jgi:hypothetical protein
MSVFQVFLSLLGIFGVCSLSRKKATDHFALLNDLKPLRNRCAIDFAIFGLTANISKVFTWGIHEGVGIVLFVGDLNRSREWHRPSNPMNRSATSRIFLFASAVAQLGTPVIGRACVRQRRS